MFKMTSFILKFTLFVIASMIGTSNGQTVLWYDSCENGLLPGWVGGKRTGGWNCSSQINTLAITKPGEGSKYLTHLAPASGGQIYYDFPTSSYADESRLAFSANFLCNSGNNNKLTVVLSYLDSTGVVVKNFTTPKFSPLSTEIGHITANSQFYRKMYIPFTKPVGGDVLRFLFASTLAGSSTYTLPLDGISILDEGTTYNSALSDCDGYSVLDQEYYQISRLPYSVRETCLISVRPKWTSGAIRLSFQVFSVEFGFDYVIAYSDNSFTNQLGAGKYTGNTAPPSFIENDNTMSIKFFSDITNTGSIQFTIQSYATPVITSINPTSGFSNSKITITGTGFGSTPTLTIGGVACATEDVVDGTQVVCSAAPILTGTQDVVVTREFVSSSAATFEYIAEPTSEEASAGDE